MKDKDCQKELTYKCVLGECNCPAKTLTTMEKKALTPEEYIKKESFISSDDINIRVVTEEDAEIALDMLRSSHKEEMERLHKELWLLRISEKTAGWDLTVPGLGMAIDVVQKYIK